jgi:hypothetical protein
MGISTTVFMI